MYFGLRAFILFTLCAAASGLTRAYAQSVPTAGRLITPSVFAGAAGASTGLDSGRNISLTAGIDLAFRSGSTIQPAVEYRGMYAFNEGSIDSVKNNLAGLKLSGSYSRTRPYVDFLAGRGETTYGKGGYQVPNTNIFYTQSSSNVFSVGGGADVLASSHFAVKVDVQVQRYSSPVTSSGHLYSETGTIGLVYVFHIGRMAI